MKGRERVQKGQRINSFILLEYLGNRYWTIQCDCGKIIKVRRDHIQRRKSCGCLRDKNRYSLLSTKHVITNIKINHYKQSAKARGLEWKLTNDEFYNLIIGDCTYCGDSPSQLVKSINHSLLVNGVDRVDSSKGYVPSNVVSCCNVCNLAKSNRSLNEFNKWIDRLIEFKTKNK